MGKIQRTNMTTFMAAVTWALFACMPLLTGVYATTIVTEKGAVTRIFIAPTGSGDAAILTPQFFDHGYYTSEPRHVDYGIGMDGSDPCVSNVTHAPSDPCYVGGNCTVKSIYPDSVCPKDWKLVTSWTSVEVGGCYQITGMHIRGGPSGCTYKCNGEPASGCVYNCKVFAACAHVWNNLWNTRNTHDLSGAPSKRKRA